MNNNDHLFGQLTTNSLGFFELMANFPGNFDISSLAIFKPRGCETCYDHQKWSKTLPTISTIFKSKRDTS